MRTILPRIGLSVALGVGALLVASGLVMAIRPATGLSPAAVPSPGVPYRPETPPGVPTAEAELSFAGNDRLGATNRDRLRLCVQSLLPEVDNAVVQKAVAEVLPQVRAHPDYKPGGLDVKPPAVESGCPGIPQIDRPGFTGAQGGWLNPPTRVPEASPYQVFVYLASAERLTAAGLAGQEVSEGAPRPRLLDREFQRTAPGSGNFVPVTHELYFTPEELNNPDQIGRALHRALKLEPLDEREARLKQEAEERAKATQIAAQPSKWRTIAGQEPVTLYRKPGADEIVKLPAGTLLIQTRPESPERIQGVRWLPVQDPEGRQGWVQAHDVVPAS